MTIGEFVALLVRLVFGAAGTFLAILLWSRTRDAAWVLVIVGTLVAYVGLVFETLRRFGIVLEQIGEIRGIPVAEIALENLPLLFYSAAFIVMIHRNRLR